MACIISTVATKGTEYQPRFVRATRGAGDSQAAAIAPVVLDHIDLPESDWQLLQAALQNVVSSGTARGGAIPGLQWSGKTGSAENAAGSQTHSWFVAYAPAQNPKIAICVIAENAGHGGTVAVPIAAQVVRHYLFARRANSGQPGQQADGPIRIDTEEPMPLAGH
jgi:penicillin-binding protein 2